MRSFDSYISKEALTNNIFSLFNSIYLLKEEYLISLNSLLTVNLCIFVPTLNISLNLSANFLKYRALLPSVCVLVCLCLCFVVCVCEYQGTFHSSPAWNVYFRYSNLLSIYSLVNLDISVDPNLSINVLVDKLLTSKSVQQLIMNHQTNVSVK